MVFDQRTRPAVTPGHAGPPPSNRRFAFGETGGAIAPSLGPALPFFLKSNAVFTQ